MNSHCLMTTSTPRRTPSKPPITVIPLQDLFDKDQVNTPSTNLIINMLPQQKSVGSFSAMNGNTGFKVCLLCLNEFNFS